jgi:aspartate/methionine/tyrosine aminotransferase
MGLSQRAMNIEPSGTQAVTQRIRDLKREGKDVLAFSSGEPDFPTPEHIAQAGHEALRKGYTKYAPTAGIPELREAIRDHLEEYYHISYKPEQIIVTTGAKQALIEAMMAILDLVQQVQRMKGLRWNTASGAFYVYPSITGWMGRKIGKKEVRGSLDFCRAMIDEAGIGLVPGVGFLQEGYFRIT